MSRTWHTLTGFEGTTLRGRATPVVYALVYLGLLWMSPVPAISTESAMLAGMRIGLAVAAISARGLRYLAFTFVVASVARLVRGEPTSFASLASLAFASATILVGAWLLRWMGRKSETRMFHVQGLILVAGLVTAALYGILLASGGSVAASLPVAYALGIVVPLPVAIDAMSGRWPSRSRRTLLQTLVCGAVLTLANAFIVLAAAPEIRILALSVPMGLVIWAATRGGLAPASAALTNVATFASLLLGDSVLLESEPLASMGLLGAFAVITFVLGAHVDDLREARRALEEREAVLRSIFDGSPILMGIVECSEDDALHVRANPAMARSRGLDLDGRWSSELPDSGEDMGAWLDRFREAARTGAPVVFEYEIAAGDGSKRCRSATLCHLGAGDGARPRFAYFIEDVTDRIRRADERDRFFSVALDPLCIARPDGVLERVNPAFESVLGWTADELEGARLTRFLHPDDVVLTAAELERLSEGGPRVTISNRFRCRDGSYRWLLWAGATLPGEHTIYLGAKDVTAQKETEESLRGAKEEAESAARAKMRFLAHMSHELRTPVNGIVGLVELALQTELDAHGRDYLERCRASCDALLSVVNDVLDFSKIDAGALELDSVSFDVKELVENVIRVVEVRARDKGLVLETILDPELPARLSGDSSRLRQVLLNLVANAVKFTEKGWVRVTVRLVERRESAAVVRLEVADTGVGIAKDRMKVIFDPFTQADESTSRRYGGTGLGLAIASQLVEAMGGRLALESEPGRGTLFHFTLQFAIERPVQSAGTDEPAPDAPVRVGPLRVLLAEDHPVNQLVATRLLENLGHVVETAADGAEAVRHFGEGQFDVVLMDVHMPEMDGYDAARAIRSIEKKLKLPPVPIIALTALATSFDRESCLQAGMNGYLAKPIVRSALVATLAEVLEGRVVDSAPTPA